MAGLLNGWWSAIWPNLAANLLWVPLGATHHVLMKRHVDRRHQELTKHVTGAVEAAVRKEV